MSNSVPVTIQGLTVSNSSNGGATVLTQSQANQLLQKLRSIQTSGSGSPQTIKIQAIQTNPATGARQIVARAIPISASNSSQQNQTQTIQIGSSGTSLVSAAAEQASGSNQTTMQVLSNNHQTITVNTTANRASPMKVIKIPSSGPHSAFQQQNIIGTSDSSTSMPPGVKVVKLSAASSMSSNPRIAYTSQVSVFIMFQMVAEFQYLLKYFACYPGVISRFFFKS